MYENAHHHEQDGMYNVHHTLFLLFICAVNFNTIRNRRLDSNVLGIREKKFSQRERNERYMSIFWNNDKFPHELIEGLICSLRTCGDAEIFISL